ncbi:NAD(P)-dependent oxidoreductase [Streptomyces zagrosensis]|uniref:3-hydroxyisobutyrate dehydrogenase-like beta-hydroxyacid dehydrogenase n=1 Tax=Streptomyces zagrosensis TaxID=1042984 RepID=A0A7W9Q7D0_9ACTN|nr:NAD(P)-binding domain-containing protein [Streptomyces zagrosensis]MBB5934969.1 3-hydroxyisobutyrate dehydrogenase-like beta-hydroxyacid dehydrogenase [Streptomyces zagrosensis]
MSAVPAIPSTPSSQSSDVTVIGLGPMGRALAAAFLNAGLRVTIWNRTAGRDADLVTQGATGAATAAEAAAASPLTVVSLVNYDASDAVLRAEPVATALKNRALVNLTADTPDRARSTADWATAHGIRYLDGAVMTPTTTIGTPHGVFIVSGPADLHAEARPVLAALGGTLTHLGEDIGRAAAYDMALLDIFWTATSGYAHAMALAKAEGITARELAPFARGIGAILPDHFAELADDFDDGTHSGTINPITSAVSSMAHIVHAAESHGIDSSVLRTAEGQVRRAIALGHGEDGPSRIAELIGRH